MNVSSTVRQRLRIVASETTSQRNNACLYVSNGNVTADNFVY